MFAIELKLCFSEVTNASHHHKLKNRGKYKKAFFLMIQMKNCFFWVSLSRHLFTAAAVLRIGFITPPLKKMNEKNLD
jgi:hypothetical protein